MQEQNEQRKNRILIDIIMQKGQDAPAFPKSCSGEPAVRKALRLAGIEGPHVARE
jgi:hypothetical protein